MNRRADRTPTVSTTFQESARGVISYQVMKFPFYSLFCDRSQDGVSFNLETFPEDEICAINEAVVQTNTKKARNLASRWSLVR